MHAWYPNNLLLCIRIKFPDSLTVTCVSQENSFIVLLSLIVTTIIYMAGKGLCTIVVGCLMPGTGCWTIDVSLSV